MMQIPRGTFRDLKKGIRLETLLMGLREASFSGYCKFVTGEVSALLVLRGGMVILAHSGDMQGDEALAALVQREDSSVDAILHDLNTTELDLAIEFNPAARVLRTEKMLFHPQQVPEKSARAPKKPAEVRKEERHEKPPRGQGAMEASGARGEEHMGSVQNSEPPLSPLLQELETLDMKDIEHIAETFRENCRKMIEKLELEYLLDSEKQKGSS